MFLTHKGVLLRTVLGLGALRAVECGILFSILILTFC